MNELDLIIDLHLRNDRQGPGGEEEMRRALELARPGPAGGLAVADIGCGTGAATLRLAAWLGARVTAIDAAPAFIERLRERAEQSGLGARIDARVGRMESLPFREGEFDLIWSESAIYNMGFAAGVRAWRRFLRPGGVLAVSDLTWTTASRPADVARYWTREYPGIATASANVRTLEEAGYQPLGFFFVPPRCWEEHYYAPLRDGFQAFLDRHGRSREALALVETEKAEMRLYHAMGKWYGYAFYIARVGEATESDRRGAKSELGVPAAKFRRPADGDAAARDARVMGEPPTHPSRVEPPRLTWKEAR